MVYFSENGYGTLMLTIWKHSWEMAELALNKTYEKCLININFMDDCIGTFYCNRFLSAKYEKPANPNI